MRKVALITDGWRRLFTYAWPAGILQRIKERDEEVNLYIFNSTGNWSRDAGYNRAEYNIFNLPDLSEFDGIVRENLSNPLLSNEIIADKMAVSPSTLVRRIRRLLETSPNNYVRNLRLAVAAEMLRDPQGNNISEICYTVGFSNVSYFAKCFREMFGKTPTAYAEQIRGSAASVAGPPDKEKD